MKKNILSILTSIILLSFLIFTCENLPEELLRNHNTNEEGLINNINCIVVTNIHAITNINRSNNSISIHYHSTNISTNCEQQNSSSNNVSFPYRRSRGIRFYENGNVKYAYLSQDTTFKSITYHGTYADFCYISFYKNGNVKQGHLAQDITFNSLLLARWYSIFFYENGSIKAGTLRSNVTLNGITYNPFFNPFSGSGIIRISSGYYNISFYENGNVKKGFLFTNVTLNGITYTTNRYYGYEQLSHEHNIVFYKNGNVSKGFLFTNVTLNGITYTTGIHMKILSFTNLSFNGLTDTYTTNIDIITNFYPYKHNIAFYENGDVSKGFLFTNTTINNITYPSNTFISLDENGNVL